MKKGGEVVGDGDDGWEGGNHRLVDGTSVALEQHPGAADTVQLEEQRSSWTARGGSGGVAQGREGVEVELRTDGCTSADSNPLRRHFRCTATHCCYCCGCCCRVDCYCFTSGYVGSVTILCAATALWSI